MTAAHHYRPALEVVPDPDDTTPAHPGGEAGIGADTLRADTLRADTLRADAVIDAYSPEHQFIGSLMWLSAGTAQPLLDLVPDTAIWRPLSRWAYQLIRRVVQHGDTPSPPAVLAAGGRHAAGDALNPDQPPTATQQRELALYLFETYSHAISPAAAADTYARQVLDEAYRRAFDTCGTRMQQLAGSGADRDQLTAAFAAIRDELADLWRRTDTAAPATPKAARP